MQLDPTRMVEALRDAQYERIRGWVKQQYIWETRLPEAERLRKVLSRMG